MNKTIKTDANKMEMRRSQSGQQMLAKIKSGEKVEINCAYYWLTQDSKN